MAQISYEEIVIEQIEVAIQSFYDEHFISATTLAGAAEEILGKMLEGSGKENALGINQNYIYPKLSKKEVRDRINFPRNIFKHFREDGPPPVRISEAIATKTVLYSPKTRIELDIRAEAEDMIMRAIANYEDALGKNVTTIMNFFWNSTLKDGKQK